MSMTIDILTDRYHALDNTARMGRPIPVPRDILSGGIPVYSAEQLYYMARVKVKERVMLQFAQVAIAGLVDGVVGKHYAKELGDMGIPLILDMPTKVEIMRACVRAKFAVDDELARELMETGDEEIAELNYWNDNRWGKTQNADGEWEGDNMTGVILMEVRDEVRARYDAEHNRFFASERDRQEVVEGYVRQAFSYADAA